MNDLIQLLSKLVSFRSVSEDHDENLRLLEFVKKELTGLPLFTNIVIHNKFPALIATTKNTKTPKVLLQAHIDVVSGSDKIFKPFVKDGKLFGRGVFDMKYAAACYIKLFHELGNNLPKYDLGLMLTSDEELGGASGVGQLVNDGFIPKLCVLPDGGENFKIQTGAKGIYRLKVKAFGKNAHGSRPWAGINAINLLTRFLDTLQSEFPEEPCADSEHMHNTMNVGIISGGKEVNSIPNFAEADVDIRFIPGVSKLEIDKLIESCRFEGIQTECATYASPFEIDLKNPYVQTFIGLYEKSLGKKAEFMMTHGSSDARYFADKNVPVISLRPIGGGHHSENEWIDQKSLEQFYVLLREFVNKTAI